MVAKIITFLILLCFVVGKTTGIFRCYACGFSSVDSDRSCLTITNTTARVECRMQYCTIMRQELRDPAGEISSFVRGCEDAPDFLNHDLTDSTFRTYYRACTSDLCNIGDGIQTIGGGNLSPRPMYNGTNLLVPGSGSAKNHPFLLFIIVSTIAAYFVL